MSVAETACAKPDTSRSLIIFNCRETKCNICPRLHVEYEAMNSGRQQAIHCRLDGTERHRPATTQAVTAAADGHPHSPRYHSTSRGVCRVIAFHQDRNNTTKLCATATLRVAAAVRRPALLAASSRRHVFITRHAQHRPRQRVCRNGDTWIASCQVGARQQMYSRSHGQQSSKLR